IKPCCNELRADLALPPIATVAITPREEELFWGLHGAVFYLGIRTFIYEVRTSPNRAEVIRDQVQTFLAGAPRILREAVIAPK
ncbi:MAG: TetR/AcrR family transcriptional regulator, partial [Hyphomicrobium denitrificans]|nr:TetR/AcrR family transcriptional regulator [Hyphomicrobium denitrificans]